MCADPRDKRATTETVVEPLSNNRILPKAIVTALLRQFY